MEKFGFIMHPLDAKKDVARKYPFVKYLPASMVEWALKFKGPMDVSHITGVRSATGACAEGWFVGCPLTPKQMLTLPIDFVWEKIIATGRLAEEKGAKIVGLGAFTSVVGDGGITVAKNLDIAVTTGNSYTVATAIEGSLKAARLMDIDLSSAKVAVVGASGSIGRTCALILAKHIPEVHLIGRQLEPLSKVADEIREAEPNVVVRVYTEVPTGVQDADIVLTVTSAVDAVIQPADLKIGAVVCDVARPRDVSWRVAKERDDVLVIEGGVVAVPGDVEFNFNFGFPPRTAYACMSETIILALEGKYENFTLGKDLSVRQVEEIAALAKKHGFELAGFRSFERAVTEEYIERTRERARLKRASG
ncbi:MAG: shikimate dehydrogenase [Armatimonadota bacterium]